MLRKIGLSSLVLLGLVNYVGAETLKVQLPFPIGDSARCAQNSDDFPTHGWNSSNKVKGNENSYANKTKFDLDLAMPRGTALAAAADGKVSYVESSCVEGSDKITRGCGGGFGNYIKIDHGGDKFTIYAHMKKDGNVVNVGANVVAGQIIGYSGNTGNSDGAHVHFGVHSVIQTEGIEGIGKSEPMKIYAKNLTTGVEGSFATGLNGSSTFVCDKSTSVQNGHKYQALSFIGGETPSGTPYKTYGDLAWMPHTVDCVNATRWLKSATEEFIADKRYQSVDSFALCERYGVPEMSQCTEPVQY
jgi:murein DD-endopeptidase MepM/ murein hydrolase activator NlpD